MKTRFVPHTEEAHELPKCVPLSEVHYEGENEYLPKPLPKGWYQPDDIFAVPQKIMTPEEFVDDFWEFMDKCNLTQMAKDHGVYEKLKRQDEEFLREAHKIKAPAYDEIKEEKLTAATERSFRSVQSKIENNSYKQHAKKNRALKKIFFDHMAELASHPDTKTLTKINRDYTDKQLETIRNITTEFRDSQYEMINNYLTRMAGASRERFEKKLRKYFKTDAHIFPIYTETLTIDKSKISRSRFQEGIDEEEVSISNIGLEMLIWWIVNYQNNNVHSSISKRNESWKYRTHSYLWTFQEKSTVLWAELFRPLFADTLGTSKKNMEVRRLELEKLGIFSYVGRRAVGKDLTVNPFKYEKDHIPHHASNLFDYSEERARNVLEQIACISPDIREAIVTFGQELAAEVNSAQQLRKQVKKITRKDIEIKFSQEEIDASWIAPYIKEMKDNDAYNTDTLAPTFIESGKKRESNLICQTPSWKRENAFLRDNYAKEILGHNYYRWDAHSSIYTINFNFFHRDKQLNAFLYTAYRDIFENLLECISNSEDTDTKYEQEISSMAKNILTTYRKHPALQEDIFSYFKPSIKKLCMSPFMKEESSKYSSGSYPLKRKLQDEQDINPWSYSRMKTILDTIYEWTNIAERIERLDKNTQPTHSTPYKGLKSYITGQLSYIEENEFGCLNYELIQDINQCVIDALDRYTPTGYTDKGAHNRLGSFVFTLESMIFIRMRTYLREKYHIRSISLFDEVLVATETEDGNAPDEQEVFVWLCDAYNEATHDVIEDVYAHVDVKNFRTLWGTGELWNMRNVFFS